MRQIQGGSQTVPRPRPKRAQHGHKETHRGHKPAPRPSRRAPFLLNRVFSPRSPGQRVYLPTMS
eukprot:4879309-Pyramimonas_sp.AAC.1